MSSNSSSSTRLGSLKQLYPGGYIQKSYAFLFPLLGLKSRGRGVRLPAQTYLRIKGVFQPQDQRLICSYKQAATDPDWVAYQQQYLLNHPLLDVVGTASLREPPEERTLFVFDLSYHEADVQAFLKGQYSKLSVSAQQAIQTYYGTESLNWAYLESFLRPEKYFGQYAALLGVSEQALRAGGELCDRFDPEQETFPGSLPDEFVDQLSTM